MSYKKISPQYVIERPGVFLVVAALFATMIFCSGLHAKDAEAVKEAQPLKIEGASSYVYKMVGGTELRVHVFKPPASRQTDECAAIIFYFGGSWATGSVTQFVPQARYLAGRGMVAIVADYRVLSRNKSTPFDSLADAEAAIQWVRIHAHDLRIDPKRIAAGGGSAGGHLALCTAVCPYHAQGEPAGASSVSEAPDALVLFNPVIDLASQQALSILTDNFGAPIVARAETISPLQHVRGGLPPTLILNGKADQTTPYAIAERYRDLAVAKGDDCRLVGYEGANHGFFNAPEFQAPASEGGRWYPQTLVEVDRFLTSIGYLSKPSPAQIP